jgi:hypothetical protein
MSHIPWLYPHLEAFVQRLNVMGPEDLHVTARLYIQANRTIGGNVLIVLEKKDSSPGSAEGSAEATDGPI